jgi:small subunit ribosomal protein S13e
LVKYQTDRVIFPPTGLAPEIPEDLYHLIKKVSTITLFSIVLSASDLFESNDIHQAVAVRKHLERNRKDKDSKFRLILIESRIHRLSRYYKTVGVLPPTWKYESATASTMVA